MAHPTPPTTIVAPAAPRSRTPFGLRRQVRLLAPLVGTWLAGLVALAVAGAQPWTPIRQLFLDPAYLSHRPWYTGILTKTNVVAWAAATTAAAFGAWVAALSGRRGAARFLAGGAGVTLMLLLDVWVQFHSAVAPLLGIPSNAAELIQAGLGAAWLIGFRQEIARTRWLVLVAAYVMLGLSAGIDIVVDPEGNVGVLLEDGPRLLGVLAFTHYLVLTTMDILRSVLARPQGEQTRATVPMVPAPRGRSELPRDRVRPWPPTSQR